mgnify:CR=1 FL=1
MHIVELTARNVKRLKAVQLRPDPNGNLVKVTGRNAQGKTSVLDAISLALGGAKAAKATPRPVRDGEPEAEVIIDLGDIVVTKKFTPDGAAPKLTVSNRDGFKATAGQSMLNELTGDLSFDPLAFTNQDPKAQVATFLDLVGLQELAEQLDAERTQLFEQRTTINREVKTLEARVSGMPEPPEGTPDQQVESGEVIARMREASAVNDRRTAVTIEHRDAVSEMTSASQRVADLEAQLDAANAQLDAAREAVERTAEAERELPAAVDLSVFEDELAHLDTVNSHVRAGQARRAAVEDLAARRTEAEQLTASIEAVDQRKRKALAEAELPVEGLGFDDDGLTFNGQPFKQASAAEQLQVSISIAMAANPNLRIMLIRDGSLLDVDSLAMVEQLAEKHDFQVWIEIVDSTGDVGFVIEDGLVESVND